MEVLLTAMNVGGKNNVVTNASVFIDALSRPAVAAIIALVALSVWVTKLYSCMQHILLAVAIVGKADIRLILPL